MGLQITYDIFQILVYKWHTKNSFPIHQCFIETAVAQNVLESFSMDREAKNIEELTIGDTEEIESRIL